MEQPTNENTTERRTREEIMQYVHTRFDESAKALDGEIQQGKSDGLIEFMNHLAQFHQYSSQNRMLIQAQCRGAGRVASAKRWKDMGYLIKKGESAIWIWAPTKGYTKKVVVNDETTGEEREEEVHVASFIPVPVFDESQLAGVDVHPLPAFFRPLEGNNETLLERIKAEMHTDGIVVIETDTLPPGTEGLSSGGKVLLRSDRPSTNRVLTAIHEWAHELMHQRGGNRHRWSERERECQAEATAYIVARHFGIDDFFSADYLQFYGNGSRQLAEALEAIRIPASAMIMRIEAPFVAEEVPAAEKKPTPAPAKRGGTHAKKKSRK